MLEVDQKHILLLCILSSKFQNLLDTGYTFQETLLAQIKLLNLKDLRCVLSLRLNKPLANYIN